MPGKKTVLASIRRYLIAGLLVVLPVWVTFEVIRFLVGITDKSLKLLPKGWQPEQLFGFAIPGLGIVISFLVLLLTGMLVTNYLGSKLIDLWDWILSRIPLVRSVHGSVKQILQTIFLSGSQSFSRVLLIQYPRKGLWSLAFQTGSGWQELQDRFGYEMINVFVPTTPNPTSGFLLMIPKTDAIELNLSVDEALKLVISLGVVHPSIQNHIPKDKSVIE